MKKLSVFFILLFILSCSDKSEETLSFDNLENDSSAQQKGLVTQGKDPKETSNNSNPELPSNNNLQLKETSDINQENNNSSIVSIEFGPNSENYIRANYRVTEQLARLPSPIEAIGYTESITGGLYINSDGIPNANSVISIDLSSLKSDESKRDNYLRNNSLETNKFPEAIFQIKEIKGFDIDSLLNLQKNEFQMQLIGDLTVHGVTKTKTWNINATSELGKLKGKGTLSFPFSDFNMDIPKLFFIVSVEDNITLELDFDITLSLNSSINLSALSLPEFISKQIIEDKPNSLYTNAWLCTDDDSVEVDDLSTSTEDSWKCYVDIELSDDSVIVTSSGIPNHDFQSGLGCCAQEVDYQWIIPTSPQFTEEITMAPDRGAVAITVTGVPIFGPEEGPGGDAVALHFDYFEEDRQPIEIGICGGHSAGAYFHYHFDANCLHWHPEGTGLDWEDWDYRTNLDPNEHSPVIGFAFDGFPIYGPYGWDAYKNVVEITSSYRLKKDSNGYGGIEDWEYIEGLGDTDECNGLSSSTPEVPDGIYHYVSSIRNGEGDIGFPYFLLCYHGIPEKSNFEQGIQQGGAERQRRVTPEGQIQTPDFSEIASALGITQEELMFALGGPPPDLEKASKILGIPVETLRKFIPPPPRR
ncbi:MAG: YHYH protein [Chloroflexota bacterium]|nr:YHYH protein [Chloroflexota bacterium]